MTDAPDPREEVLRKGPILLIGGNMIALYAYRVADDGIYFCEMRDDLSGSTQVNFTTSYVLMNSAGRTYRDQHISALVKENAERALFGAA
jgi:hypothetical protein